MNREFRSGEFGHIVALIQQSRDNAYRAVNAELVNLYWQVGHYVSMQLANAVWGDKTVEERANYIQKTEPMMRGFNKRGIYRMRQFYETYKDAEILAIVRRELNNPEETVAEIVSPLVTQLKKGKNSAVPAETAQPKKKKGQIVSPVVTQLKKGKNSTKPAVAAQPKKGKTPIVSAALTQIKALDIRRTDMAKISWTNHLLILSGANSIMEKEFYIKLAAKEKYSKRELERQIASGLFERVALSKIKLSLPVKGLPQGFAGSFKDKYVFEFLNLPEPHSENDLQKAIIQNLKKFLLEFSRDFAFLGEEFVVQVGNKDFAIDLLFFNRALNCLVAIELKVVDFIPEYLGKLNFYLEALDMDVKKPHENPSIGILLCKAKDDEVVEYAISRQVSPAMVAQYQVQLPDKKMLQAKLHEFFEIEGKGY